MSLFFQCLSLTKENSTQKLFLPSFKTADVSNCPSSAFTFQVQFIYHLEQMLNVLSLQGSPVIVEVPNGSLYLFDGGKTLHATSRPERPNRLFPSRVSLVFYR